MLAALAVFVGLSLLGGSLRSAAIGLVLVLAGGAYLTAPLRRRLPKRRSPARRIKRQPDARLAAARDPVPLLRETMHAAGAGVFVGVSASDRAWTTAGPEQAVLVLGPPRSGKTSGVIVPAILSALGAVVSTSTKLDVLHATAPFRSQWGKVWVFDPSGQEVLPKGAQQLRWSPVRVSRWWDHAVAIASGMVSAAKPNPRGDAEYWNERAAALLATLLHAAAISGRTIVDVRTWVLRQELNRAAVALERNGDPLATDVIEGIAKSTDRARTSIFSTAASVLSAYNSGAALRNCERPNFDAAEFVDSCETVYITAPGHLQSQLAPLVVGLLDEIRQAAYARTRAWRDPEFRPVPVVWALDEVANIAPLATLPAIVSEGGGQGLQVIACFQDLSQARARWGPAADGFLSLFGTKMVFGGIGDVPTLQALSTMVGVWDRPYFSSTQNSARSTQRSPGSFFATHGASAGVSTTATVRREAILPEGEIANLPDGCVLLIRNRDWSLVRAEPYFASACWQNVRARAPREIVQL
jgi:type IV secretion system protein VirD4